MNGNFLVGFSWISQIAKNIFHSYLNLDLRFSGISRHLLISIIYWKPNIHPFISYIKYIHPENLIRKTPLQTILIDSSTYKWKSLEQTQSPLSYPKLFQLFPSYSSKDQNLVKELFIVSHFQLFVFTLSKLPNWFMNVRQ